MQRALFMKPNLRFGEVWDTSTFYMKLFSVAFNLDYYSSNKIRKTQNQHMNIVCQNLNSQ